MKQYNQKHDAYYDDEKDVWLEEACEDPGCEYCSQRPAHPSEVESK